MLWTVETGRVAYCLTCGDDPGTGTVDAADARFQSRGELRTGTPQHRASGLKQVLAAIDEFRDA